MLIRITLDQPLSSMRSTRSPTAPRWPAPDLAYPLLTRRWRDWRTRHDSNMWAQPAARDFCGIDRFCERCLSFGNGCQALKLPERRFGRFFPNAR
jgi:hypothetical protein